MVTRTNLNDDADISVVNPDATIASGTQKASASEVTSAAYAGMKFGVFTLSVRFSGGAPAANSGFNVFILRKNIAGTYEDGDDSVTPQRPADFTIPVRPVTTAQRIAILYKDLPPNGFKAIIYNNGTGQTADADVELFLSAYTDQIA